jgi:Smg protein
MSSDPARDRVLAVVTVIAQYVLEGREIPSEKLLVEELLDAGFASEEIEAAFGWLEHLSLQPRKDTVPVLSVPNHRVFTSDEVRVLSAEARGFLVRLRGLGILDDTIQEEIIEKALDSSDEEVSLSDLKTITALTVFAHSNSTWRREVDCLLDEDWSRLYH